MITMNETLQGKLFVIHRRRELWRKRLQRKGTGNIDGNFMNNNLIFHGNDDSLIDASIQIIIHH